MTDLVNEICKGIKYNFLLGGKRFLFSYQQLRPGQMVSRLRSAKGLHVLGNYVSKWDT